jgi:predicted nuclease of restriction endonuclease-like (RecB) superfamily
MKEISKITISDSLVTDLHVIIEEGRKKAFAAAGKIAILTYWNIGRRIVEEEQQGNTRADYGKKLIPALADRLTIKYGSGYNKRNLAYYRKFYLEFKDIEILHTRVQNLNWSHIRRILSVSNPSAREWYLKTAAEDMWSVKTLDRNISTQYYERRLASQCEDTTIVIPHKDSDPMEYIKNPMVAEFMGFRRDNNYSEDQLEQALVDNLEKFILELGRGFAFVERQQHIVTDTADFYIDLVFYNFKMKRFVLFELKTHKLTH